MTLEYFLEKIETYPVVITACEDKGYIKIRYNTGAAHFPVHRTDKMQEAIDFCENYKY